MLGNCCCPLKSKFLLSRLKAASGYGCDKGNLYIKQMSAVDSLLGPVTFLLNFQADFHCNLCIFIFLWSLNLLLPTDSLASIIKISMPCLADSDCSKQVANLSIDIDNSASCPNLPSSFCHYESSHQGV